MLPKNIPKRRILVSTNVEKIKCTMEGINRIYFETSAINYIFDNTFNDHRFSSIETKRLQIAKGRKWQISNVALWEIFLTKNVTRRYDLFDFSRCLFFDNLISTPEEIITNYIKSGCPRIEKQYKNNSSSLFSKEWNLACKDLNYSFQPDREHFEILSNHFRFLGEYFVKTSKGYSLKTFNQLDQFSDRINGAFLKYIFDRLLHIYGKTPDENAKNYIAVSLQVTMMVLCYGIGFDQATIEQFWNNNFKKTEPLERLELALNHFPDIFFRGPLANVSRMIILQANNKTGRGLFFDSLHAIYTTYCDLYISNDEHFLKFKTENMADPNMNKVISPKELKFS